MKIYECDICEGDCGGQRYILPIARKEYNAELSVWGDGAPAPESLIVCVDCADKIYNTILDIMDENFVPKKKYYV